MLTDYITPPSWAMLRRRRRRLQVLCMVAMIACVCYVAGLGWVTGTGQQQTEVFPDQGSLSLLLAGAANVTASALDKSLRAKDKHPAQPYSQVMADRRERMLSRCGKVDPVPWHLNSQVPFINPHYSPPYLHCPITKAASTFWNRFLLTLNTSLPTMPLPFSFPLGRPLPKMRLSGLGGKKARAQFVATSFKTLFVRDPYQRMFSAYVDKVLGPNPYYWKEWGTHWTRFSRQRVPRYRNGALCYHDLKFSQVMAVAAASFYKSELHFIPASVRCIPCKFRYDVVGKMETFSQDLVYISRLMNLSLTEYYSSKQFRLDYVKDAIEDCVNSPFSWQANIYRCISKFEMGLRIWRKLQIRGLVDRRIQFPYSQEEFQNVTAPQLIEVALKAHLESTDRGELKRQKRQAFVEAYRTVDMEDLKKLQKVFRKDFLMFGYDSAPQDVFDRQRPLNVTGAFNWLMPWMER